MMTKDESWKEIVSNASNPASPSNEVNFQSLQDKLKNRMILQNATRILNRQTSREKRQAFEAINNKIVTLQTMMQQARNKNKKPKFPYKRYKNGWNMKSKAVASWKLKENPNFERHKNG